MGGTRTKLALKIWTQTHN